MGTFFIGERVEWNQVVLQEQHPVALPHPPREGSDGGPDPLPAPAVRNEVSHEENPHDHPPQLRPIGAPPCGGQVADGHHREQTKNL